MYSQANHLSKLIELRTESLRQFHYWMNRYGFLKRLENPKKAKVWE